MRIKDFFYLIEKETLNVVNVFNRKVKVEIYVESVSLYFF